MQVNTHSNVIKTLLQQPPTLWHQGPDSLVEDNFSLHWGGGGGVDGSGSDASDGAVGSSRCSFTHPPLTSSVRPASQEAADQYWFTDRGLGTPALPYTSLKELKIPSQNPFRSHNWRVISTIIGFFSSFGQRVITYILFYGKADG